MVQVALERADSRAGLILEFSTTRSDIRLVIRAESPSKSMNNLTNIVSALK